MNNLIAVYQYYQSLGFSYNGSNTKITREGVTTGSETDKTIYASYAHADEPQANATSDYGMMVFGSGHTYMNPLYLDREAVAHEFGHLVTQQLCSWHGVEMGHYKIVAGLAEAYSDILSELMSDAPDWKVAAGAFKRNASKKYSFRNIADPAATVELGANGADEQKHYYKDYLEWASNSGQSDSYAVSTIFSHAAYQMYQSGIPVYDLRQIWYQSLSYYPSNPQQVNYMSCRFAVLNAAEQYLTGRYRSNRVSEYIRLIENAFDEVGIRYRSTQKQFTTNNATNMSNFIRGMQYRYPTGNYWTTGDVDRSTRIRPQNNFDESTYMPEGPTVGKDFAQTNWESENEPYYQCAGFAKKLQVEYYGTRLFTQLEDSSSYVPKMGDHIRLIRTRSPLIGHSIFVKSVSGNTIYYAQCDGGDYSRISLAVTGSFSYDNRTKKYTFTLNGVTYDFVWAQRPIPVGDVNADSVVDAQDLTAMNDVLNHSVSCYGTNKDYQQFAADIDEDGEVTENDHLLLEGMLSNNSIMYSYGYIDY